MAKIDILLPYWGDFQLLKKAVESVLNQTETDWRLLVFDDCYPSDEPKKFFAKLNDSRVSYHRHKRNLGITQNFNYALGAASAEHFVMFGCDDIMLPNFIETALNNIGNADFYQPGVEVINESGSIILPLGDKIKRKLRPKRAGLYEGEKLAASLCHGNWLYFPSIVWKTSTVKKYGFNPKYKIVEDVDLQLSIIKDGGRLYVDNTYTFQYRRFASSLSSKEKSKEGVRFSEEEEIYNKFSREFQEIGWRTASRAARWRITSRVHRLINKLH